MTLPEVAPIAPPVEGTNGGYHRAPEVQNTKSGRKNAAAICGAEVPTAWADEGEAPHFRGKLGFGLI